MGTDRSFFFSFLTDSLAASHTRSLAHSLTRSLAHSLSRALECPVDVAGFAIFSSHRAARLAASGDIGLVPSIDMTSEVAPCPDSVSFIKQDRVEKSTTVPDALAHSNSDSTPDQLSRAAEH